MHWQMALTWHLSPNYNRPKEIEKTRRTRKTCASNRHRHLSKTFVLFNSNGNAFQRESPRTNVALDMNEDRYRGIISP